MFAPYNFLTDTEIFYNSIGTKNKKFTSSSGTRKISLAISASEYSTFLFWIRILK
jgi:hypothetical protein